MGLKGSGEQSHTFSELGFGRNFAALLAVLGHRREITKKKRGATEVTQFNLLHVRTLCKSCEQWRRLLGARAPTFTNGWARKAP